MYLSLFFSFFKIGLFGFGGGYAMLSLIQHEVVEKHEWISMSDFTDIVAIAFNSATYIGYTATQSVWGSAVCTFAVSLPSLILMVIMTKFFLSFRGNRYVAAAIGGLKTVVVGLIGAGALLLVNEENFIDYKSVLIFLAAFVLTFKFKMDPILMLVLAGAAGYFLYG